MLIPRKRLLIGACAALIAFCLSAGGVMAAKPATLYVSDCTNDFVAAGNRLRFLTLLGVPTRPQPVGLHLVTVSDADGQTCTRGVIRLTNIRDGTSKTYLVVEGTTVDSRDLDGDGDPGIVELELAVLNPSSGEQSTCTITPDREMDEEGTYQLTLRCQDVPGQVRVTALQFIQDIDRDG